MLSVIDFLVLPTFYRIAGSDFPLPGRKALRRYGIPAYFYFAHSLPLLSAVVMALIFTFNLDEIERLNEKDEGTEEIFLWGLGLAWCLYPLCGAYSLMLPCVWVYVVMASNRRIWPWTNTVIGLNWRWAEVAMGITLAFLAQL